MATYQIDVSHVQKAIETADALLDAMKAVADKVENHNSIRDAALPSTTLTAMAQSLEAVNRLLYAYKEITPNEIKTMP